MSSEKENHGVKFTHDNALGLTNIPDSGIIFDWNALVKPLYNICVSENKRINLWREKKFLDNVSIKINTQCWAMTII